MDIENIEGITLDSLVGEHFLDAVDMETTQVKKWGDSFYNAEVIRFRLDGKVYNAVDDPSDGYRSNLEKIFVSSDEMKNVFSPVKVLARMNTKCGDDESRVNDTLELLDCANGKTILRVGTDNTEDYYPWFVSEWTPANMAVNEGVK